MCVTMPDVRVGEPLSCGSLAVFPLFSECSLFAGDENRLEYLLAHEAMARGSVVVTEVSDEGVVGDLLVRNDGETPVLMLDGSSLMGGKQIASAEYDRSARRQKRNQNPGLVHRGGEVG